MKKIENRLNLLKGLSFRKDATQEVHEAIKTKGTATAKYVNQKISRGKQDGLYMILVSETKGQFTVYREGLVTKQEQKQIALILGLEYIKAGTIADEHGLWVEYADGVEVAEDKLVKAYADSLDEDIPEDTEAEKAYLQLSADIQEAIDIELEEMGHDLNEIDMELFEMLVKNVTFKNPISGQSEEKVIEYRSMPWGSMAWSEFRFVCEVKGNEFGYYVQCNSFGEKEYKVMAFNYQGQLARQQVLAHEDSLEGVERCLNNFIGGGFQFFMWEMEPQNIKVKMVDAMTALANEIKMTLVPTEIRAKLDIFTRYNELLMKSLGYGLTDEESAEYDDLYKELKLQDGNNLYNLLKAQYELAYTANEEE
jgi:hypothetical protein